MIKLITSFGVVFILFVLLSLNAVGSFDKKPALQSVKSKKQSGVYFVRHQGQEYYTDIVGLLMLISKLKKEL